MPQGQNGLKPVHQAMAQARPEKLRMRELWMIKVNIHADFEGTTPLYLTLSGAEGNEFRMLGERGFIQFTETNALDPACVHKVVAIENNAQAYAELQANFPGLKIIRDSVHAILHGNSRTRFPAGEVERICRAKVVNLDLNEAWMPVLQEGNWLVPVSSWVAKLAEMHARAPKLSWTLYLTLHGECPWDAAIEPIIAGEIAQIIAFEPATRTDIETWIGQDILDNILANIPINYLQLPANIQQKLLMWLVPCFIAKLCRNQGWVITVCENLHYGVPPGNAPMVSWIINFEVPTQQALNYDPELKTCLRTVLSRAAEITSDGQLQYYFI